MSRISHLFFFLGLVRDFAFRAVTQTKNTDTVIPYNCYTIPFYHLGVETGDRGDTELVDNTGLSPGEGSLETTESNPTESKKQGVQENDKEDKWDTGDVVKENLIFGERLGKLKTITFQWPRFCLHVYGTQLRLGT